MDYVQVDPLLLCIETGCLDRLPVHLPYNESSFCQLGKHQCYNLCVCCILLLMPHEQLLFTGNQLLPSRARPSFY
ncbi:hypothetical protein DPMN_056898 [Dreissena polymorpha]|uniref:Uncharacterized protein n=1 Tax=Dreissena polymorpha TaxID=45954 RepID=A0A9D4HTN1_DREPO|nr:hypothetical protein DPMN_056898 [Dreissena polymorpha]